jgi:regulator of protease activity HflC (stomatin/prohibitin superfamily)
LHWKWPFFDEILVHLVKPTTLDLDEQTITTKDGVSIVVKGVIKYEVSDVVKLLLEVDTPVDALKDMSKGIIRNTLTVREWKDCNDPDLSGVIQDKIKGEAKSWGIKVLKVTLTDLAKMTSIRLLNSSK